MNNDQAYNIEFKDILRVVKKRFYIVILITIPILLLALYYGINSTTVSYRANASMIIGNPLDNAGRQFQIDDVSRVQAFMGTYCAIAKTTAVSEKTISKMNLNISTEGLKSRIAAIPQMGTPFIELTLTWKAPQEAIAILDTLVEVYIEEARSFYPTYSIVVMDKVKSPQVLVTSNKILYTGLGLAAGIIISLLLIFALEFMNSNLSTEEDVESSLKLSVLGKIPRQKKRFREISLESIKKFNYAVMEAYRSLRTNVCFTTIQEDIEPFVNTISSDLRAIAVTSGMPGEGKTSVASMLAVLMAQNGERAILVDCNLRKPDIHNVFNLVQTGLSDILIGGVEWKDLVQKCEIENLYILTAGMPPPNPAELLVSSRMKELIEDLKSEFNYVILDTPPVCLVTDAQVLSQYVDGYLLVISSGKSKREEAIKAKKLIQYADGKILGVALNKIKDPILNYRYKRYFKKATKMAGSTTNCEKKNNSHSPYSQSIDMVVPHTEVKGEMVPNINQL